MPSMQGDRVISTTIADIPDLPKELQAPLRRALRKAGSTAIRDERAELSKRVRDIKRIKAKAVRAALKLDKAKGGRIENLEWSVSVSNDPARVADYPHRQTKRGVSAGINRGKRSLIKGAFIATMQSGHRGVFVRAPASEGEGVDNPRGKYKGKRRVRRLPIAERLASRVLDAALHQGIIDAVQERGQESFAKTLDRVLPLEIEKAKAKKEKTR